MSSLELWRHELDLLPPESDRADVASRLGALERAVHARLLELASSGWAPGRGRELSELLTAWRDATLATILRRLAPLPEGLAVVALGGWGRRELAPFSDLDLLMLYRGRLDSGIASGVSDVLYHLWDTGYAVASSTRALRDIPGDAAGDLHFLTSLMDARLLGGEAGLFAEMRALAARVLRKGRRRFLHERVQEVDELVRGAGDGALRKEPNVKCSPGGLRSVHLLGWMARALWGAPSLDRLLTGPALSRLRRSHDFLLHIRLLLHLAAGRREDTLGMEHQATIASSLGIAGSDGRKMVKLMRHYYERSTDVVLCLLEARDRIGGSRRLRPLAGRSWLESDGERLAVRAGSRPDALKALEAATACARLGVAVSGTLVSYLRASAREMENAPERELFLRFRELLDERRSHLGLAALKLSGFLYAYLRPLRLVRHRIEHNPFHRSTVDQHSLDAVRELESFATRSATEPERFRLPAAVAAGFSQTIWVAKLALLLHDTGKAYEGEHAKNGTEIVRAFMRGLPTESLFKDMVVFLTENHLLMSAVTRRRAAGEPGVVETFALELARLAYPAEALELLYLVSCADVAATNERAYTAYVAANLASLYRDARAALTSAPRATGLAEAREGDSASRPLPDLEAEAALIAEAGDEQFRLDVSIWNDHLRVRTVAADRPGLFSILAGILLVNGADIVRAAIHTHRGVAIDEFFVTDVHGNDILEAKMEKELAVWIEDLRVSFRRYWRDPGGLDGLIGGLERGMKPVHPAFRRDAEVSIRRTAERTLLVEIECTDRPALLYDLTHHMAALGLDVRTAAIETTGWYVRDSFEARAAHDPDDAALELMRRELERATEARASH